MESIKILHHDEILDILQRTDKNDNDRRQTRFITASLGNLNTAGI